MPICNEEDLLLASCEHSGDVDIKTRASNRLDRKNHDSSDGAENFDYRSHADDSLVDKDSKTTMERKASKISTRESL
jgi:hypothetical protein